METLPSLDFKRKIKLGYSKIHGRGVFATSDIEPDELIERAPLLILAHRMNYHKDPIIWNYCFTNTCPCDECKKHGGHFLMVLGYGQIYNHLDQNNANISFDLKNLIADIKCIKKIKKGEEIFVNYGPKYFNNKDKLTIDQQGNVVKYIPEQQSVPAQNQNQLGSCTTEVFKPL